MCFWYKVPKFENSLVIFSLANWSNTKIPAFLPASLRAVQIPEFLCRVQKPDILPVSKIPALSRAWHPTISLGRGDFDKKSQKVPAFWKMAAVTVIRLSGYIVIPFCTSLTCRCFSLGVENAKQHLLTLVSKYWFNMFSSGSMTR